MFPFMNLFFSFNKLLNIAGLQNCKKNRGSSFRCFGNIMRDLLDGDDIVR